MKRVWGLAALCLPMAVYAGAVLMTGESGSGTPEAIGSLNNAAYVNQRGGVTTNTTLGIEEVGNGGTTYFDDNAAIQSHTIYTGGARLIRAMWNGSTTAVVTFYDDEDGTCDENRKTPTFTVPSVAAVEIRELGIDFSNAICMLVATAADAEITLVYVP